MSKSHKSKAPFLAAEVQPIFADRTLSSLSRKTLSACDIIEEEYDILIMCSDFNSSGSSSINLDAALAYANGKRRRCTNHF